MSPDEENLIRSLHKEIADLKAQIRTLQDTRDEWIRIFNEKDARIAELESKLTAEIENRKGWQDRAADAETKIYRSETPCPEEPEA
jgi:chromosome segregation ATPase